MQSQFPVCKFVFYAFKVYIESLFCLSNYLFSKDKLKIIIVMEILWYYSFILYLFYLSKSTGLIYLLKNANDNREADRIQFINWN